MGKKFNHVLHSSNMNQLTLNQTMALTEIDFLKKLLLLTSNYKSRGIVLLNFMTLQIRIIVQNIIRSTFNKNYSNILITLYNDWQ